MPQFDYAPREKVVLAEPPSALEIRAANWKYLIEWYESGELHVCGVGTLNLAAAVAKNLHRRAECFDVTLIDVEHEARFCVIIDGFKRLYEPEEVRAVGM
jgi:hypothetical protein